MSGAAVAVRVDRNLAYPVSPPFHAPEAFAEIRPLAGELDPRNLVYAQVRNCLADMGLDRARFGTSDWNPLSEVVRPGDTVLVKPNLVLHFNGKSDDISAVVTHGSVLRPIVDYVLLALQGRGRVVVGDAPHGNADFARIVRQAGVEALLGWYRRQGHPVSLMDFRRYGYGHGPAGFVRGTRRRNPGSEQGVVVDLGAESLLHGLGHLDRLYGSDPDRAFIVDKHTGGRHAYCVTNTALEADAVISVPKLKTHKKTGVTISLKNLVGINADKNFLAHYRIGSPEQGGDEFPPSRDPAVGAFRRWNRWSRDHLLAPNTQSGRLAFRAANRVVWGLQRVHRRLVREAPIGLGDWHGNDTTWRTCLDLNRILKFADKHGVMQQTPQRRLFSVVDGIVAGEGEGPMEPTPRQAGLVASGTDLVAVDWVCTWLMGFEPRAIPKLAHAVSHADAQTGPDTWAVHCRVDDAEVDYKLVNLQFQPHSGWIGFIERPSGADR